jgi:hypothetical protein
MNPKTKPVTLLVLMTAMLVTFGVANSVNSTLTNGKTTCQTLHEKHLQNPNDREVIIGAWEMNCPFQDKQGNYLYTWEPNN